MFRPYRAIIRPYDKNRFIHFQYILGSQIVLDVNELVLIVRPDDGPIGPKYVAFYVLLTLRLLMSYIYTYIYMEHLFLMFLDHTQRRATVGRTPLDE